MKNHKCYIQYLKLVWYHANFWTGGYIEEEFYLHIGTVYFDLGNYRKAISSYKKSEKAHNYRDGSFTKYNSLYLGYSYLNLGNYIKAIEWLETYKEYNRKNIDALNYLGWCYLLVNQPLKALETYSMVVELDPTNPVWNAECAKILIELKRNHEALKHIELAKSNARVPIENEFVRIIENMLASNYKGAIDASMQIIAELNNESFHARFILDLYSSISLWQKKIGDMDGALNTLEQNLKNAPEYTWAKNDLAMEYADRELKLDTALNLINEAIEHQPDNSFFIDTKGWVLFKRGNRDEAKIEIEKSLELNPDCKETLEHYEIIKT